VCHRILSRGGSRGLEWGFRVGEREVGKVFDGALLDRRPGYAVVAFLKACLVHPSVIPQITRWWPEGG
jgi:hypothetical protein